MLNTIFQIIGFYLLLIGTWRLANATKQAPVGDFRKYQNQEDDYNPLRDLISIPKVLLWMFKTIVSFNKPGKYTNAVIMHKKFSWGLLWLLLGICIQFLSDFIK